ncbi:MAG: hypothetical protein EOO53_11885 [Gammaproteobacteria bacterium]|nr:MAG: hypothetical protein EOO53_11885 [Gammaproteobacteria bacterium]
MQRYFIDCEKGKAMESPFMLRNLYRGIWFAFLWMIYSSATASTEASISWLKTQQQGNGSFTSPSSSQFLSTTEVIEASLLFGKSNQAFYTSALHYLNESEFDASTEGLSRRIVINYRNGVNTSSDVAELLLRKNRDGGFGSRVGYDSTVFDTAYASWALGLTNVGSSSVTDSAVSFIIDAQSVNGGWGLGGSQSESLSLTSLVLETLRLYSVRYNLTTNINKGSDFLYSLEYAGGGWGNNELTADALIALIPITIDANKYSKSLSLLKTSQNINQSWDNDAYITARALRVIYLSQNTPPPILASDATVSGQIIDKVSGQPLSGVGIVITGADTATATTDSTGKFSLSLSKLGGYSIAYSLIGFNTKTQTFNLAKLQSISAGSVALEKNSQVDPQISFVSGRVKDATQGTPVQNVQVYISGANSISVTTNLSGEYQAVLPNAGNILISISKSGYQPVTANGIAVLGQAITFSPSLYSENDEIPLDIIATGKIIDASSSFPIASANFTVKQNNTESQFLSNESGYVVVPHLLPGNFSFKIDASGYESVTGTGVAAAGSKIDLGTQSLKLKQVFSTVAGKIKNANNNNPIIGATVKIVEDSIASTSKADGSYSLTNITRSQFSIDISASGFKSETYQINAPDFQSVQLDAKLTPIVNPTGFGINSIDAAKEHFGAYEKGSFNVSVYNNGAQQEELQMVMEIKGNNGFFQRFPAAHSPFPGDLIPDSILVLGANTASTVVEFNWLTSTMQPGDYQLRIMAYDAKTLQLKSEKSTSVKIAETKNITALIAKVTPRFAYYHAQKEIVFTAEATNASNITLNTPFKYRWKDPQGTILKEGNSMITLLPTDTRKIVELARFTYLFEKSGDFILEFESLDGSVSSMNIFQDKVSVAPAVRIDASLDVNPTVVTPEQDKTIRLNIKLTGKDEK